MPGRRVLVLGGEGMGPFLQRLREAGFDPAGAPLDGDGLQALDAVRPELILLPARAAGASGVTRHLRDRTPAPIVWIVEAAAPGLAEEARACGVAGVVRADAEAWELGLVLELSLVAGADRQRLRREVARLEEALATRKLVERAKGVLMDRYGFGEAEAYDRMRRLAMGSRQPLRRVAEVVIALGGLAPHGRQRPRGGGAGSAPPARRGEEGIP